MAETGERSSPAGANEGIPLPVAGGAYAGAGTAAARFSYTCNRCNRCCRDKRIQVNPYEVVRLARNRGISTGDFIERHIDTEQMALRKSPDGSCVFLGSEGCTVHEDRPLVCRLYPLGRISRGGREKWVILPDAPGSEGIHATDGSVRDYVREQGAIEYMRAADAYHAVVEHLMLQQAHDGSHREDGERNENELEEIEASRDGRWLLDMDAHIETSEDPDVDLARHVAYLIEALSGA